MIRTAGFILLLGLPLAADVVVLKSGERVAGRVADKKTHYEVTTEGGLLRTYLKDEVERVVTSPKDLLGGADSLFEEAKKEFQAAVELQNPAEQNARLKGAIGKVTQAREAYAGARELFPEDKHSDLDQKLMQIMQLMRLLRDRLGSEIARGGGGGPGGRAAFAPPPRASLDEAFSILKDPAKRSDYANRATAREAFRAQRAHHPEIYEVATAAMLFLAKSDAEWRLEGAALKALQDYFARPWLKQPASLTPVAHQEAAAYVLQQIAAIQKADPKASLEPLSLFGIGHVGHAPAGAETDKAARLLGLMVKGGVAGTPEGHVVRDLNGWIANGDFDLAVLAWVKEFREIDTPVVRYVWSWALLQLVHKRKRGFDRPIAALGQIRAPEAPVRDHLAALAKSIRDVAPCTVCAGEGNLRCTNCHGKKAIMFECKACGGTGRFVNKVGTVLDNCPPCKSSGFERSLFCTRCKDGTITCKQCQGKTKQPPELEAICTATACGQCDGRGYVFRKILWACKACLGSGVKLAPAADPSKLLP